MDSRYARTQLRRWAERGARTLTLVLLIAGLWGTVRGAGNPHEVGNLRGGEGASGTLCRTCHRAAPGDALPASGQLILPDMANFTADGIAMCVSCHGPATITHPVGARPDFPVPADLPLDGAGRVTCLTCHYTHGSLYSERPWCSVSLLDRLFDRGRLHKTYLLRRNNAHGELCKACHNPEQEKTP